MVVLITATDEGVEDFGDGVGIVLGPLVAAALAQFYASALSEIHKERRLPSAAEVRHYAWYASQYLLVGVIPLVLLALGKITGKWSGQGALEDMDEVGLGFLLLVGAVSGWRVAAKPWLGLLAGGLAAFLIGFVIVLMKLVLEH